MRSSSGGQAAPDDRSTAARIRDAAIGLFAEKGVAATTVRQIAEAAEVSPGLVIHHFGSKDGLRVACDEHIVASLREMKAKGMQAGLGLDFGAAMRDSADGPPIVRYLARTLTDGSPHVLEMVREMVDDAVAYTAVGVEQGLLTPTEDAYGRAAVMTIWSLGALVLHEHLEHLLGVDLLAAPTGVDPDAATGYVLPIVDLLSNGFITAEAAALFRAQLTASPEEET